MPKSRRYPGGRATTLKPAFEPIVLARRALAGTTEETIARYGTGALNAEACRVKGAIPPTSSSATSPTARRRAARRAARRRCSTPRPIGDGPHRAWRRAAFLYCPKASRAERDAGCEELPARALDLFPNAGRRHERATPATPTRP